MPIGSLCARRAWHGPANALLRPHRPEARTKPASSARPFSGADWHTFASTITTRSFRRWRWKDLIPRFGVSEQQASGDLTRYQEIAPDNLVYDKSDKTYRADARVAPRFLLPDTDELLSWLRLTAEGVAEDHPLISSLSLGIAPAPARPIEKAGVRS